MKTADFRWLLQRILVEVWEALIRRRIESVEGVFFPNLVELAIKGFDSRMTNAIIKGIDNPNLASLIANPDVSTADMMGDFRNDMTKAKEAMGKIQSDFLELAHKKFPRLERLNYTAPDSAVRIFIFS